MVPLLELFSSNGGTFQFQRQNSLVPRQERFWKVDKSSFPLQSCGILLLGDGYISPLALHLLRLTAPRTKLSNKVELQEFGFFTTFEA